MRKREDKLAEAEYFLKMMNDHYEDVEALNYNYSAFLNASRSVIQYIFEEVEHKPTERALYDRFTGNNSIIKFFRDKRNLNIHHYPIKNEKKSVIVQMECTYTIKGQLESPEESLKFPLSTTVNKIENCDSKEQEIVNACDDYIQEIKKLLIDGKNKGYIN